MYNKQKHAYLIIAHNNFYVLEKLLRLLDYELNDIYIHIDKKVKAFDFERYKSICKKSSIIFTQKRINVKWGTQSQIKTEMNLYETAYGNNKYKYYHLISGVDLPLKSQEEIHSYFDEQVKDSCYLFFRQNISEMDRQRVSRYHFVTGIERIDNYLEILQAKLKVDRLKNKEIEIYKGANWASLTENAVKILLNNKKSIYEMTKFSLCADEVYKQTILHKYNVDFFVDDNNKTNDLRYIVFQGGLAGHPYVFRREDFNALMSSGKFFARKFDENIDKAIIDMIYEYVKNMEDI